MFAFTHAMLARLRALLENSKPKAYAAAIGMMRGIMASQETAGTLTHPDFTHSQAKALHMIMCQSVRLIGKVKCSVKSMWRL